MRPFFVYILQCADASYYCGHTDDMEQRMLQHESGLAGYTATRKPVTLLWKGGFEKREEAIAFERRIKGWSRAKKEALIAGDWKRIRELARSKNCVEAAGDTPFDKLRANGVVADTNGVVADANGVIAQTNGVEDGTDGLSPRTNGVVAGAVGEKG